MKFNKEPISDKFKPSTKEVKFNKEPISEIFKPSTKEDKFQPKIVKLSVNEVKFKSSKTDETLTPRLSKSIDN